ncbi:MAG: FAD:protein FMN transferase [Planctomycetes bacterium]|nr:FAD:protein FMN transferase [Planctomycetota bacterium]
MWPMMGSYLELVFHGRDQAALEQAALAVYQECERLDGLLSRYDGDSEISLINALAAERPIPVEPTTFDLLVRAGRYWEATRGAFDITAGPLVDLWRRRIRAARPTGAEIAEALARVGFRHLLIDAETRYVAFDVPGMEIDLGGIGKGFAADRAAEIVRGLGVWSGLVSLGGSSILAIGGPPGETAWTIEIEHPLRRGRPILSIDVSDEAVSSSGTRRRSLAGYGDEPPAHIVDPRTGGLANGPLAVTVVAPGAELAETLSTAIMILDRDESLDLLRRAGAREAIAFRARPGGIRWERLGPDGWQPAGEAEDDR